MQAHVLLEIWKTAGGTWNQRRDQRCLHSRQRQVLTLLPWHEQAATKSKWKCCPACWLQAGEGQGPHLAELSWGDATLPHSPLHPEHPRAPGSRWQREGNAVGHCHRSVEHQDRAATILTQRSIGGAQTFLPASAGTPGLPSPTPLPAASLLATRRACSPER